MTFALIMLGSRVSCGRRPTILQAYQTDDGARSYFTHLFDGGACVVHYYNPEENFLAEKSNNGYEL